MIKGNKISLRYINSSELEELINLINNVDLKGDFVRSLMKSPIELKNEFALNGLSSESSETLAIVDKSDQLIGIIAHFKTVHYSTARELGFSVFDHNDRNKGFAQEAVQLLTTYLFQSRPINRIQICMVVGHEASEKVAISSGYIKEGIIRGMIFIRGRYLDGYMYAMLRSDFEKST